MGVIRSLFEKLSFENPAQPLTATIWDHIWPHSGPAGVTVNETTALTFGAVFAARRILSESLGVLPIEIFERKKNGDKEARRDHWAYELAHNRPNNEMDPAVFQETKQNHIVGWGHGVSRLKMGARGRISEMIPLHPDRSWPERKNGELIVRHHPQAGGPDQILKSDEALIIPGLGADGVRGYSPIRTAARSIGIALATLEFATKFFDNGAWFGGTVETEQSLTDKAYARINEDIVKGGGIINAFKPLVLDEGLKFNQMNMPREDMLLLSVLKWGVTEIARIYRIPNYMLNEGNPTFNNIAQLSLDFVKWTLMIWLVKWQQQLSRKLFVGADRGKLFAEFNLNAILRGDLEGQFNALMTGRQGEWLSINDIRRILNYNGIGPEGDTYQNPNTKSPDSPPPAKERTADDQIADQVAAEDNARRNVGAGDLYVATINAQTPLIEEAAARCIRRQRDRISRAYKRKEADAYDKWLDKFFEDERHNMAEALRPAAFALAQTLYAIEGRDDIPNITAIVTGIAVEFCETKAADLRSTENDIEVQLDIMDTDAPAIIAADVIGSIPPACPLKKAA